MYKMNTEKNQIRKLIEKSIIDDDTKQKIKTLIKKRDENQSQKEINEKK